MASDRGRSIAWMCNKCNRFVQQEHFEQHWYEIELRFGRGKLEVAEAAWRLGMDFRTVCEDILEGGV